MILLRKDISPYEYIYDWEKFYETLLHEREDFYSHFNMEDITDADYTHAKRLCKDFDVKNLKNSGRISSFVCSKWYFIVSWCIWEL